MENIGSRKKILKKTKILKENENPEISAKNENNPEISAKI